MHTSFGAICGAIVITAFWVMSGLSPLETPGVWETILCVLFCAAASVCGWVVAMAEHETRRVLILRVSHAEAERTQMAALLAAAIDAERDAEQDRVLARLKRREYFA